MTTEPPSPPPKRRSAGWRVRGLLLLAIGAAAYYSFELLDRAITQRLIEDSAGDDVIQIAEMPADQTTGRGPDGAPSQGPGNALLRRAVAALDSYAVLNARVQQTGWLADQPVETQGDYTQTGTGEKRKFLLRQQGLVAGEPTRLLRVSDSQFLWTDLAWGSSPEDQQRSVTRVDLRRVKRALEENESAGRLASDPSAWSRYGGLPTLLAGLEENFAFGDAYRMQFRIQSREEVVLAMVGRWRPERLAELTPKGPPARTPHHVVVALVERNLMPAFLEYRSRRDPLSAEGLSDYQLLLSPSARPLLKIDLAVNPTPDATPDPRLFAYQASTEAFDDQTDRELRLVEARRPARVAAR